MKNKTVIKTNVSALPIIRNTNARAATVIQSNTGLNATHAPLAKLIAIRNPQARGR